MFGKSKEAISSPEQKSTRKEEIEKELSEIDGKMRTLSDERSNLIPELEKLENEVANKRMHVQNLTDDIRYLKTDRDKLERELNKINK